MAFIPTLYEAMDILDDHEREPFVYWDQSDIDAAMRVVADDHVDTHDDMHIDVAGVTCGCDRCRAH